MKISNIEEYYKLSHHEFKFDTENFQNKIFGLETNSEELNAMILKVAMLVENTARMKLKKNLKRIYPVEIIEEIYLKMRQLKLMILKLEEL